MHLGLGLCVCYVQPAPPQRASSFRNFSPHKWRLFCLCMALPQELVWKKTAIPTEIPVPLACGQQGSVLLDVNGTSDCCPAIDYHLYHLCWKTTWGLGVQVFQHTDCFTSTLLAVACSARHSQPNTLPFRWSVQNGFLICAVMLPSAGMVRQKSSWLTTGNLSKKYFSIWEWNHCGSLSACELKAGLSALQAFPSAGNALNSMLPE